MARGSASAGAASGPLVRTGMLVAPRWQSRVTARRRHPRCTSHLQAAGARHSLVRISACWLSAPFDINILPYTSQVNHRAERPPPFDQPVELEVTFCVLGVITAPCGVPTVVAVVTPSSITPALSHRRIKRRRRRSPMRCSRKRISHSWLTVSKENTTHYPSRGYSASGARCPQWARI